MRTNKPIFVSIYVVYAYNVDRHKKDSIIDWNILYTPKKRTENKIVYSAKITHICINFKYRRQRIAKVFNI